MKPKKKYPNTFSLYLKHYGGIYAIITIKHVFSVHSHLPAGPLGAVENFGL